MSSSPPTSSRRERMKASTSSSTSPDPGTASDFVLYFGPPRKKEQQNDALGGTEQGGDAHRSLRAAASLSLVRDRSSGSDRGNPRPQLRRLGREQPDLALRRARLRQAHRGLTPKAQSSGGRLSAHGRTASNAADICSTPRSSNRRPTICRPTGRPSLVKPQGTDAAGFCDRLKG